MPGSSKFEKVLLVLHCWAFLAITWLFGDEKNTAEQKSLSQSAEYFCGSECNHLFRAMGCNLDGCTK